MSIIISFRSYVAHEPYLALSRRSLSRARRRGDSVSDPISVIRRIWDRASPDRGRRLSVFSARSVTSGVSSGVVGTGGVIGRRIFVGSSPFRGS